MYRQSVRTKKGLMKNLFGFPCFRSKLLVAALCRASKNMPILEASSGFNAAQINDSKLFSEAASRNVQPILDVIKPLLADCPPGPIISVAEGSGQHVISFARSFPQFTFHPTDIDMTALESIAEYRRYALFR